MADTGFILCGAGTVVARAGSTNDWSSPGNITADDGSESLSFVSDSTYSDYLRGSSFGLSIPAGSTIDGIELEYERRENFAGTTYADSLLSVKGGSNGGTDKGDSGDNWSSSAEIVTEGGATDLWGQTWSAADVNSSDFGFDLSVFRSSSTASAQFDYYKVKVYYTEPTGNNCSFTAQAQDSTASFSVGVEADASLSAQAQDATASFALVRVVELDVEFAAQAQNATASFDAAAIVSASLAAQAQDATASLTLDDTIEASFAAQAQDATASVDLDNVISASFAGQAQNVSVTFDLEREADVTVAGQAQNATTSFSVTTALDASFSAQAQDATASISLGVETDVSLSAQAQAASTDIQVRHELGLSFAPQARDATTSFNTFVIRSSQPSVIRKVSEVKAIPEPVERFFEKPGAYQYFLDLARTLKQFQSSAADDLSTKVTGSEVYPIGSVYINNDDGTDPADLLGYGTWSKLGQGEIISGVSATNSHVWKRTE